MSNTKKTPKEAVHKNLIPLPPIEGKLIDPLQFYAVRAVVTAKANNKGDTEYYLGFVTDDPTALQIGEHDSEAIYLVTLKRVE